MQSQPNDQHAPSDRISVGVVTSDADLYGRFTGEFAPTVLSLQDAVAAPERLTCRVILLDVRSQHCHLQASRLATHDSVAVVVIARPEDTVEAMRYLDLGVTDVLWSSMSSSEMHARIRAAARYVSTAQNDWLTVGRLTISLQRQEVRRDGEVIHLTPTEYRVLETLVLRSSETVAHQSIMARVWGQELLSARHYLRVYIRQLREKLEIDPSHPRLILTVPGGGYCFNAAVPGRQSGRRTA